MTIPQGVATVFAPAFPEESTTCAVKENVAAVLGVPLMTPVMGFNNKPPGSAPAMIEKLYGETPPFATTRSYRRHSPARSRPRSPVSAADSERPAKRNRY